MVHLKTTITAVVIIWGCFTLLQPVEGFAQEVRFEYAYTIGELKSDSVEYLFSGPKALVTDDKGRVYIADGSSNIIKVFNQKGRFVTGIGRRGRGPGEFLSIEDLAVDSQNNLYVLDRILRRVTVFTDNLKDHHEYTFDAGFTDPIAIYPLASGEYIILATGNYPSDNIKLVYTFDNRLQTVLSNYLAVYPTLFGSKSPLLLSIMDSPDYNSTFYGNGRIAICHKAYSGKTAFIAPDEQKGQRINIIGRWKSENYKLLKGKSTMEYIQDDIKGLNIHGGPRGSFVYQTLVWSKALVGNKNYFLNFLKTVNNKNKNISSVRIYNSQDEFIKEIMLNDTELNLMKDNGRTGLIPLHMDDNNFIYIADYTHRKGPVVRVVKMVVE